MTQGPPPPGYPAPGYQPTHYGDQVYADQYPAPGAASGKGYPTAQYPPVAPPHDQYPPPPGQYPPPPGQYPPPPGQYPPPPSQYQQALGHTAVNVPPPHVEQGPPRMDWAGKTKHEEMLHEFAEKTVRHAFIRKVFSLVAIQLAITAAFTAVFLTQDAIKEYVTYNNWILYVSSLSLMVLVLGMTFMPKIRVTHPWNLVLLFTITLVQSVFVGAITARYDVDAVLLAFGCTCVAVFAVVVLSFQKWIDITRWGGYLFITGVVLVVCCIVGIFWRNVIFHLVLAAVGALLACFYLLFTMQLLFGGKTHKLSPDEYVIAALNIYLDIINIFLNILRIIGLSDQL